MIFIIKFKTKFQQDEEAPRETRSGRKFDFKQKSGELKSILKIQVERLDDSGFGDSFVVSNFIIKVLESVLIS